MHQCEFCCWYAERYGTCECPTSMKRVACEKARKEKERVDEEKRRNGKNSMIAIGIILAIVYVIVMILVVYNLLNAPRDYDE